jgi:hypothetical protein
VFSEDLFNKESIYGDYDPDMKLIRLQKPMKLIKKRDVIDEDGNKSIASVEFDLPSDVVIETFYHELTHCILDAINEHELFDNERLVGNISEALLQIMKCSETNEALYERKTRK